LRYTTGWRLPTDLSEAAAAVLGRRGSPAQNQGVGLVDQRLRPRRLTALLADARLSSQGAGTGHTQPPGEAGLEMQRAR
jgi:hypothetical protein